LQDFPHLGLKFGHIISRVKVDEPVKSHKNVSLLTKRECYFNLSTDIIKISLFVGDDKLLV